MRLIVAASLFFLSAASAHSDVFPWPPEILFDQFKEQRDARDLAAQEAMALWAYWMLIATLGSIAVGAGGIAALVVSIRQTAAALQEARRANEIADMNFMVDTRPWILIENVSIEKVNFYSNPDGTKEYGVTGTYFVRNIGKTPAVNVNILADLDVNDFGDFWGAPLMNQADIAPGERIKRDIAIFEKLDEAKIEKEENPYLWFHVLAKYKSHHTSSVMRTQWVVHFRNPANQESVRHLDVMPSTGRMNWIPEQGKHLLLD